VSETHYWPGADQPGEYIVERSDDRYSWEWNGSIWIHGYRHCSTEAMKAIGYLGVRREPERLTPSDTAETLARSAEDNDTLAREAREELRMCRRSYEFERWAIKWGPVLCQMMGAE